LDQTFNANFYLKCLPPNVCLTNSFFKENV